MASATLFSAMAFRLTPDEKTYLGDVGLVDHFSVEDARNECLAAGATDWMIFSSCTAQTSSGQWVRQGKLTVVESTIPRKI